MYWTNEERTEFCIPWKHALRQDSNSDDILIFKAWAGASLGRQSDGGTPGDPSVWKRNFRSALRARGFKMVFDNKNDAANPHKVYRWPPEGSQSEASCEASPVQDSPSEMAPLAVYDNIYLGEEDIYTNGNFPNIIEQCMIELNLSEQQPEPSLAIDEGLPQVYTVVVPPAEGAMSGDPIQDAISAVPQHPVFPPEEVQQESYTVQQQVATPQHFKTCFKVVVHYRGKKVMDELVTNEAGFRLAYRREDCMLSDPSLLTVILPSPENIPDKTQAKLTSDILQNLGAGLEVRVNGNIVYGSRHGDSKIFWGVDKHEQTGIPRELAKQEPEAIFSLEDFINDFTAFINKPSKCPPVSCFFCLGEKWPDPKFKPWEKKLILVEVIFDALEGLKLLALANGASSLQSSSVELQLSLGQVMMDMS